jgi:hypothetical protein
MDLVPAAAPSQVTGAGSRIRLKGVLLFPRVSPIDATNHGDALGHGWSHLSGMLNVVAAAAPNWRESQAQSVKSCEGQLKKNP